MLPVQVCSRHLAGGVVSADHWWRILVCLFMKQWKPVTVWEHLVTTKYTASRSLRCIQRKIYHISNDYCKMFIAPLIGHQRLILAVSEIAFMFTMCGRLTCLQRWMFRSQTTGIALLKSVSWWFDLMYTHWNDFTGNVVFVLQRTASWILPAFSIR